MLERRKGTLRDIDRILGWLAQDDDAEHPITLSDVEQTKLERLDFTDSLLRRGYARKTVRNIIEKKYGIQRTAAYKVINEAQELYAASNHLSKDYYKTVAHDWISELYRKAVASNNLRMMQSAIKELKMLMSLNEGDTSKIPANALDRMNIYLVADPSAVGITPMSREEIDALMLEVTGKGIPKTIDIPTIEV
jgi:hypothetical protein